MTETLPDGTQFGAYTVQGLVAGGGMGQVYVATDSIYGDTVALKVLHGSLHADEGWRSRFNHEGLVGTRLKHPHVLAARELVENEGRVALVLDLIRGAQTLEKVVSREFREGMPLVPALQVFLRILQGIDYLHGKGIVHGDIKPENVMISGDFRSPGEWSPKVTDFGTVALIADPVEIDGRPAVVATPRYASPEHLLGVHQIAVQSDIYCLGLVLHFMLTGRHASDAKNVREAADRVLLPVPIVALVDQPDELIDVFKKATARDPEQRTRDVRDLAVAVRSLLDAAGVSIDPADVQSEVATEIDEERDGKSLKPAREQPEPRQDAPEPPKPGPQRLSDALPQIDDAVVSEPAAAESPSPSAATAAVGESVPPFVWAAGAVAVAIIIVIAIFAWPG